jgi:hypothetical protein
MLRLSKLQADACCCSCSNAFDESAGIMEEEDDDEEEEEKIEAALNLPQIGMDAYNARVRDKNCPTCDEANYINVVNVICVGLLRLIIQNALDNMKKMALECAALLNRESSSTLEIVKKIISCCPGQAGA